MIYIGIDSGTQSTKAIALDYETGEIVAQASQPYDLISGCEPVISSSILKTRSKPYFPR